jgi:hypothetical protein
LTERGGIADAFNTFTMQFSDNSGLTAVGIPDVSAIPLPAGAWLFLTGIGVVAGLSRRRKALPTS